MQLLNTLYVTTPDSYLRLDNDTLRVEVERETKLRIPLHHLGSVVCFGHVGLSAPLMHRLADESITLVPHASGGMKRALRHYIKPTVLCVDELGYLPIDKFGADCLFQIISHRYERGATLLTTNRTYKQWASIFNNDAVLTSALLDRLLHHAETVRIEGKSFRSKDQVEV